VACAWEAVAEARQATRGKRCRRIVVLVAVIEDGEIERDESRVEPAWRQPW
jgi:hypothetical protein